MVRLTTIVCLSFIVIGLIFVAQSSAKIDPETCVGAWFFDGQGDTAKDSSENGNDGILMSKPKRVDGKFGKALEFDGNNYVEVPHADSLTMTNEITVAFWFRTDKKMPVFDDRQAVVGKHYLEYEVGIYPSGVIHTYTSNGAGGYDEGISASKGGGDWVLDQWYHLAWTLDGRHEIVYVDGINIGEFDKPNEGTRPGTHTLDIGRRQGGGLPLQGAVDEVAVFNAVLSEEDVQACMDKGLERALGFSAIEPLGKLTTTWGQIKK